VPLWTHRNFVVPLWHPKEKELQWLIDRR